MHMYKLDLFDQDIAMGSVLHNIHDNKKLQKIYVMVDITSAVLRLECSLVCISGSVGHQQNIFRSFSHCQRFF